MITNAVDVEFITNTFYGVIDGMSGTFTNDVCTGGMTNVVDAASGMINNAAVYMPANVMKFSIASNNFQEAQNTVVAYCDFSGYGRQISKFTQYKQWENYIRVAGRVGGVFIGSDWTENYDCIN